MSDEYQEDMSIFEFAKSTARGVLNAVNDIPELMSRMRALEAQKERLENELKEVNAWYDVCRIEVLPAKCEEQGIDGIKVAGVGKLVLTGDMYVRTMNSGALMEWLKGEGLVDLIKPSVNSSTLKASLKTRIKSGAELPPDSVVKVTPFIRASITKA